MLRPYQQAAFESVIAWIKHSLDPCLIEAATGCHAKGHPILLYDGSIKNIEDITDDDVVMGPDSSPRHILKLHYGVSRMYKIIPVKGESFIVNDDHVLNLYLTKRRKNSKIEYLNISLKNFLNKNNTFKHCAKLHKKKIYFKNIELPIDPWVVGTLIGDGCLTGLTPTFCSPDDEVVSYLSSWAESIGCKVNKMANPNNKTAPTYSIIDEAANRSNKNKSRSLMESIGIYFKSACEKFIPQEYKTSSIDQRLYLIAGLIDTDGHLHKSGYDWISKSERLADDMVFLCRSVGLSAYKKECIKSCQNNFSATYYRVSISGDCSIIPCKIKRKQSPKRKQIKNNLVAGFSVEYVGIDEYYGFELDGDSLYLDGHFTVHHNSGKSHIIAAIANEIHKISKGKHVLCLAPNADLVMQNREKYLATGNPASIFSASAGAKYLSHPVVFGTPLTVLNSIENFCSRFAAIIIDEAHGVTPTIKDIVSAIQSKNKNCRVIGLSATPFRLGTGYIYQIDENGRTIGEDQAINPYFKKLVCKIEARQLIEQGFLTDPLIGNTDDHYDTSGLELNRMGHFDTIAVDRAFVGHGRKTSKIIEDVIFRSQLRKGVMIFAATVAHAVEIMASLPAGLSRMIGGDINTEKNARKKLVLDFKARRFKYLVSVGTMTTGVDFTHVDVIAILRATESVALLQQIIGRGLRLCEGKTNCLILDYAENLDRHCPDGDVFAPKIKTHKQGGDGERLIALCPDCGYENDFSARQNEGGFGVDENGYFIDLAGQRVATDFGDMPAHYGRKCQSMRQNQITKSYEQCNYRWTYKKCESCGADNDIAARRCTSCKAEIVDPNEKLKIEFTRHKRNPYGLQTDAVKFWSFQNWTSANGGQSIRVDYTTECRSFSVWYSPKAVRDVKEFLKAVDALELSVEHLAYAVMPKTITYKKNSETGFYKVYGYNQPADELKNEIPTVVKSLR